MFQKVSDKFHNRKQNSPSKASPATSPSIQSTQSTQSYISKSSQPSASTPAALLEGGEQYVSPSAGWMSLTPAQTGCSNRKQTSARTSIVTGRSCAIQQHSGYFRTSPLIGRRNVGS